VAEFNRLMGGLTGCIKIGGVIPSQVTYRCDVYEMHGTRFLTGRYLVFG